jgi:alkaline phosphatase D
MATQVMSRIQGSVRRILFCLILSTTCLIAYSEDLVYFSTGYKIGEVTQSSAIAWVRLTAQPDRNWDGLMPNPHEIPTRVFVDQPEIPTSTWEGSAAGINGETRLGLSTDPLPDKSRWTDWVAVNPNADYTHKFRLNSLTPDTRYYVRIEGRKGPGGAVTQAPLGQFKTPAPADTWQEVWFTVSSCQMYAHRDDKSGFLIYPAMSRARMSPPDFAIRTGDAVYLDRDNPRAKTMDLARLHWQRMFSLPLLREFFRNVPCYWMKDDHDSYFDDSYTTLDAPWIAPLTYQQGVAVFREQTPVDERLFRTVRWGKGLQIWMTEGRDFRSPNPDPDGPEKTLWGKEQKEWLLKSILESDAVFKVLVNPTAIVGPDNPNQEDNQADPAFGTEGRAFRRWTLENHLDHLYVSNGDRHWQYMSTDPESGLREFSVGPSSDRHVLQGPQYQPKFHSFYREGGGFLSVSVSTGEKKVLAHPQRIVVEKTVPTIIFRFHDVNGKLLYEYRDTALISP